MAKRNSVGIYLFGKAKARLVTYTVLCGKGERSCLVFFLSEQSKEYDASPGSYEKKLKEKISWLKKERSRCIKISLDKKYDKEEKNDFRKKIDVNDYIYGKLYEICDKDVHFTIPKVASAMVYMELEETFKNFKIFKRFFQFHINHCTCNLWYGEMHILVTYFIKFTIYVIIYIYFFSKIIFFFLIIFFI